MELATSKVMKVKQADVIEAVLSLVFKKRPELRPSGIDASEQPPEVAFRIDEKHGVTAIVLLESKCEEVTKP
jgi:hypothetical protein